MKDILSEIRSNIPLSGDIFILEIYNSAVAKHAKPGQFVMIKPDSAGAPLLRRPFSVHSSDGNSCFSVMIRIAGEGTRTLSRLSTGGKLSVLGPLGRGFDLSETSHCVFVGGGIGIAPLLFAVEKAVEAGRKTSLFYGARSSEEIVLRDRFNSLNCEVQYCTDDGSFGEKSFVSSLAEKHLKANGSSGTEIFACGPEPLLKKMSEIAAKHGIRSQISCEQRMACGIGVCLGCTCGTINGNKKTCVDGPVFYGTEIVWK